MTNGDMREIVELRADRALLNSNFDHYLLANRQVEMRKIALPRAPLITFPSSAQFGYQHAKLYSRVERLILDLFKSDDNEDHLYTFLDDGTLVKLVYNISAASFVSIVEVASVDVSTDYKDTYPPSLLLPSADCAVVSNGAGHLTLYDTMTSAEKWQPSARYIAFIDNESSNVVVAPLTESADAIGLPFLVVDARHSEDNRLSVLLETVVEKKQSDDAYEAVAHLSEKSLFFTRLIWLDLNPKNYSVVRTREAHYTGHLELATLNHNATELVTVGPVKPTFAFDSERPVEATKSMKNVVDKPVTEEKDAKPLLYVWTQDAEEITVTFALAEPIKRCDVVYNLTSQTVDVEIKGIQMLSGKLEGMVHLDSSTWTIHDNSLQITLFKARGHFWRELVIGDKRGLYQPDPQLVAEALESLEKFTSENQVNVSDQNYLLKDVLDGNLILFQSNSPTNPDETSSRGTNPTFNNNQLEDCDNTGEDTSFICWTDGDKHQCAQMMDLSCCQFLFLTRLLAGGPKSMAMRQENDGIVWSLNSEDLDAAHRIRHKFTLDAFGYVQAGHTQKLYSGCSVDGSYAFVIHANHHVLIYLQSVPVGNGCSLVNRKTKRQYQEVKEQLVVNTAGLFDQSCLFEATFIGYSAASKVLYLLARKHVVACHVKV